MERMVYILYLLTFMSCQTLGQQDKQEDVPMNVNLGQQLVGRKNESSTVSTTTSVFVEGGSISLNKSTTQPSPVEPKPKKVPITLLGTDPTLPEDMADSWPEGHDKNSSSKPRKGAPPCSCCVNITTEEQWKNCTCCPADFKFSTVAPTPLITKPTPLISKPTTMKPNVDATASTTSTSTATTTTSKQNLTHAVPIVHHQKPNVTADAPDTQVPAKQEDYVIPVVGIIFAIPLVIILGALVYKKGADLWERRHYRRMDFLIDGIYNQ